MHFVLDLFRIIMAIYALITSFLILKEPKVSESGVILLIVAILLAIFSYAGDYFCKWKLKSKLRKML